jgi:murein DD-endopeptidase MepM/ murein hydrolase activator NlpD
LKHLESRASVGAKGLSGSSARGRRWLVASLGAPLLMAGAAYWLLVDWPRDELSDTAIAPAPELRPLPIPAPRVPELATVQVKRDDTLDRIFRSAGIDLDDLAEIRNRPEVRRALDILRPGDVIRLTHMDGILLTLNRQISDTLTLSISRANDGYAVNFLENPLEIDIVERRGRIDSTLYEAGQAAGLSSESLMTMATKIFGYDIDFANDIRAGDEFGIVVERRSQDGRHVGTGRVLAAEFVNRGKTYRAAWFRSADGEIEGYFTPEGRNVKKAFLRAPLDFLRVSSPFSKRRLHPVTGVKRPHKGIDYAAPTGTPIYAAGDGRVAFSARKGGYGNAVIVDHGRGIETLYAHMSRFARGVHAGKRVKQGEVIGYVGMTGLASGPHLHYEYRVGGQHRNPASIPPVKIELPRQYLDEFHGQTGEAFARLDGTTVEQPATELVARN